MQARARGIGLGVGILLVLVAIAIVSTGRFASGSATDIRAAKVDALWRHLPPGSQETARYAVRADAAWVPWSNPVTSVGRYYRAAPGSVAPAPAWVAAAISAGWKPVVRACGSGNRVFTKRIDGKTARLTVGLDASKTYVRAAISFGHARGSDVGCGQ